MVHDWVAVHESCKASADEPLREARADAARHFSELEREPARPSGIGQKYANQRRGHEQKRGRRDVGRHPQLATAEVATPVHATGAV